MARARTRSRTAWASARYGACGVATAGKRPIAVVSFSWKDRLSASTASREGGAVERVMAGLPPSAPAKGVHMAGAYHPQPSGEHQVRQLALSAVGHLASPQFTKRHWGQTGPSVSPASARRP